MKSKAMKRWLLTIWIMGICLTGFAQAGSTPLLVKGTVDVPYVEEVGLYRSIDGFWECVAKVKLMDGKSPLDIELPGPLTALKKPLLHFLHGTVVEKLLEDHGILRRE